MENRISRDNYFMEIAEVVAKRSTCIKRHVGAVLVTDKQIQSTGYNGAPRGMPHCNKAGCIAKSKKHTHDSCRAIHTEQNAILQVAANGGKIRNSTLYCTCVPCAICFKLILNLDIARMVIRDHHTDEVTEQLMAESGFQLNKDNNFIVIQRNNVQ